MNLNNLSLQPTKEKDLLSNSSVEIYVGHLDAKLNLLIGHNLISQHINWTFLSINLSYIFFFFKYNIKILLYSNLSIYVCKVSSWNFERWPLLPTFSYINHYSKNLYCRFIRISHQCVIFINDSLILEKLFHNLKLQDINIYWDLASMCYYTNIS